ncbi:hypothetical protein C5C99_08940 [Rathayibacter sp. AY1C4]|nr:hypothetical protein C5C99_08940 [Rathayibacter sp. AY1C4]
MSQLRLEHPTTAPRSLLLLLRKELQIAFTLFDVEVLMYLVDEVLLSVVDFQQALTAVVQVHSRVHSCISDPMSGLRNGLWGDQVEAVHVRI